VTAPTSVLRSAVPLPLHIDLAEFEDPTLLVGGEGWSLSATCIWRWVSGDGVVVSGDSIDAADVVWNLVGDDIIAVRWTGPEVLGSDPSFDLRSGGTLDLLSDATFDTWVLHVPHVTLVGPLRGTADE
jgi:hypothetical protein